MSVTVRAASFPQDRAAIARLCEGYRDLLIARSADIPGFVDLYYAQDAFDALIADLPRLHARPKGDILLADIGDTPVGCAMYYPLATPDTCEIKRIFVSRTARGAGAGRDLIAASILRARADGHRRMVLDTIHTLTEAIALYEAMGFAPCAPFYDPDPRFAPVLRFYDIAL